MPNSKWQIGAPGEIRTPDLLLRRQSLYPAELRARRVEQLLDYHFRAPASKPRVLSRASNHPPVSSPADPLLALAGAHIFSVRGRRGSGLISSGLDHAQPESLELSPEAAVSTSGTIRSPRRRPQAGPG